MWRETAVSIAFSGSTIERLAVGSGLGGSGCRAGMSAVPALRFHAWLLLCSQHRGPARECLCLTRPRPTFNWGCLEKYLYAYLLEMVNEKSKQPELFVEGSATVCLPGFVYDKLRRNPFRYKIKKSFIPHRFSGFPDYARFEPVKKTPLLIM